MDSLEKLLLLEVLVDSIYYERGAMDPDIAHKLRDSIFKFEFLKHPPIEIGEVDFCQTGEEFENSEIQFKSGKSVLFAVPDINFTMKQPFDLNVTVIRKMFDTPDSTSLYEVGRTVIHLGDSFANLVEATTNEGICPTSRTVRDSYPFTNTKGETVGFVNVFIRLSCFGKIIVTQFQADALDDKSFCFKGGEDEAAPQPSMDVPRMPSQFDSSDPYGSMGMPGMNIPVLPGVGMPGMGMPGMGMPGMGMPGMGMPGMGMPGMGMPGMGMPGMSGHPQIMQIPVPLKKKPVEQVCGKVPSELVSSDSEGEKPGPYCLNATCPQGYSRPPWISGAGMQRKASGPPVGAAAFRGEDVLFQMSHPFQKNFRASKADTVYKIGQEPDQILQQVQLTSPENQAEKDDEHDVFLMKFGKCDNDGKPAKLIITMKTPKAPLLKEHKCVSEKYSQTEKDPPRRITTEMSAAAAEAASKAKGRTAQKKK